jgi:hypothetical protein
MATGTRTARSTARKGATATRSRAKALASEAAEYEEVKGGGDFPDTWDFEEQGDLVGTFTGSVVKEIKGKDRTIHEFEVDGEVVQAWGAAILDSRLSDLDAPVDVKVVKTGDKIKTKSGHHAAEYKVFVKRGALKRSR